MMGSPSARSTAGWVLGASLVAIGQVTLPFVDGDTLWSFDGASLSDHRAGDSAIDRLVTEVASAWVMPGAVVAAISVLLLATLAATGHLTRITRIGRYLPAATAWLAPAVMAICWAAVAFAVNYLRTPRPGIGLFVSMLGALVLTNTPSLRAPRSQTRTSSTTHTSPVSIS